MIPFFDLKRQFAGLQEEMFRRLEDALPAQMLTGGPDVERFEQNAARYLEVDHAVSVSNGTDALLVALMALDVGPGDEVIVPAFTFFSTASVVARLGARPVFADIDPATFNVTPAGVEPLLSERTRAIVPVHLFGQSCDLDGFAALAEARGVALVEDVAQAFGASWRDDRCGSVGAMGAFSFYPTKNMGALGEGGLIGTHDGKLARKLRALRNHGQEERDVHRYLGGNFRLAGVQCLALDIKLRHVDLWIERRRKLARRYLEALAGIGDLVLPSTRHEALHTYNQFTVRTGRRDGLREHLTREGIGTGVYYARPVPLQPAFEGLGHRAGEFPEAERAARDVLSLPIFPELTDAEQETVIAAITQFFAEGQ